MTDAEMRAYVQSIARQNDLIELQEAALNDRVEQLRQSQADNLEDEAIGRLKYLRFMRDNGLAL